MGDPAVSVFVPPPGRAPWSTIALVCWRSVLLSPTRSARTTGARFRIPQDGDSSGPAAKIVLVRKRDVIEDVLAEVPVQTV
jgi:hypothetical protein